MALKGGHASDLDTLDAPFRTIPPDTRGGVKDAEGMVCLPRPAPHIHTHLLPDEEEADVVHLVDRHVALLDLVDEVVAQVGDQSCERGSTGM